LAIIIGLLMIIDFIIEDLMLNSYLQKNFHTLLIPLMNEGLGELRCRRHFLAYYVYLFTSSKHLGWLKNNI
ncbi:hypothetical protein HMPREF1090_04762, partial [[Clostridium] clostridioforme 90A8]